MPPLLTIVSPVITGRPRPQPAKASEQRSPREARFAKRYLGRNDRKGVRPLRGIPVAIFGYNCHNCGLDFSRTGSFNGTPADAKDGNNMVANNFEARLNALGLTLPQAVVPIANSNTRPVR